MEMFNSTLKSEDVKFFYRVLYQYEKREFNKQVQNYEMSL